MEAIVAVLPELDGIGQDPVATPERRERDVPFVPEPLAARVNAGLIDVHEIEVFCQMPEKFRIAAVATCQIEHRSEIQILYQWKNDLIPLRGHCWLGIYEVAFAYVVRMATLNGRLPFDEFVDRQLDVVTRIQAKFVQAIAALQRDIGSERMNGVSLGIEFVGTHQRH